MGTKHQFLYSKIDSCLGLQQVEPVLINHTISQPMKSASFASKYQQPFLSWFGSKRLCTCASPLDQNSYERVTSHPYSRIDKLVSLVPYVNPITNRAYVEPFLGSGSLFFAIGHQFKDVLLSDSNKDLVTTWRMVRDRPTRLLEAFAIHCNKNSKQYFDEIKKTRPEDPIDVASLFLYLNKFSYRSIYRFNSTKAYEQTRLAVYYSGRASINLIRFNRRVYECSNLLMNATIEDMDFEDIESFVEEGDFVYCDPPYHMSGECLYTTDSFDVDEQLRLRDFVYSLTDRKVNVLVSNSDTSFVKSIYSDHKIGSFVNRNGARELMITNF